MKKYLLFLLCLLTATSNFAQVQKVPTTIHEIVILDINSSINPATYDYLQKGLQEIHSPKETLLLIKMNTPGGLVTTTKDIMTTLGKQDSVAVIWITPEGASATSAGAIIASSSHALFMSPGTNIGAATPVGLGGDIGEKKQKSPNPENPKDKLKDMLPQQQGSDMRAKAVNDLVALTQSLSEARGRNPEAFGKMISEAASYNSKEALEKNIINGIAHNYQDIISWLKTKTITVKGEARELSFSPTLEIKKVEMSVGQKILNIFSNPSTAYVLFMIGAALLYLEFQAPGGMIAGSVGTICLVLAGIGFQVLPINWGGLALILVAFVLFVMEIYITSYGILSLSGIAALVFGSLMLYRTDNAYIEMQASLIYSVIAGILVFGMMIVLVIMNDRKKAKPTHFFNPTNEKGTIMDNLGEQSDGSFIYQVKVAGEIWKTQSKEHYQKGDYVQIESIDNEHMKIDIKKYQGDN